LKEERMEIVKHFGSAGAIAAILASIFVAIPAFADVGEKPAPKSVSRSGIPYRPDNDKAGPPELVSAIRARRAGGKLLNLDRMLLHSPSFAKGWNGMFAAIRNQLSLPAKLRELSIMSIGVLNRADYEWAQHEGEFLKAGGTKEQLAALKDHDKARTDAKLFDEAELATLALTSEMTREIAVSEATMKRVRAVLPDQQVVELVGTIAGYNMVSRFLVATGVELE
jgi:alkylhydroperoxidase family enzyme